VVKGAAAPRGYLDMADGVRLYAATYDGVQVLSVRGSQTTPVAEAFTDEIVQALGGSLQKPERIFVGLRNGLHRSDDAGVHWRKVLDGDFRSIAVDPTNERVVYAGTDPVRLFRSEDGGDRWEELSSLQRLPEETHHKLGEADPADMAGLQQPGFRHRRQDWWFPVPPHQGHILGMFIHPDDPNLLLMAIEHGGVARSTDRGRTWEDVSEGVDYLDMHSITSLPHRFDRYFVTSARGLYTTDDPAHGWTRAQNGIDRDYFHDLLLLPSTNGDAAMIVASADGSPGFWPALKGREHWDSSKVGARAALFRTDDNGQSWRRIGAGQGLPEEMGPMIWALCAHPTDSRAIFGGVGESAAVPSPSRRGAAGALVASSDGGESWQTIRADMAAVEHLFATPE
jgi:photosystem II stability/assembly factor-like uncharacterized protein